MGEQIRKVWEIDTVRYYPAIKKAVPPFVTTQTNLEDSLLSETSQTERQVLYGITYV